MTDERRCDRQPGLHKAALAACVTRLSDGFCTPTQNGACPKCWPAAEAVMQATGCSAQAAAWIFDHINRIEDEAAKANGTVREFARGFQT